MEPNTRGTHLQNMFKYYKRYYPFYSEKSFADAIFRLNINFMEYAIQKEGRLYYGKNVSVLNFTVTAKPGLLISYLIMRR